jgi:hypothetical protein
MFQKNFSGVCGKPKVSAASQAKTRRVLFGIAVMLIAAVFTLSFAGCDDGSTDDGGGPIEATLSLAAGNAANTFTLTVTGCKWKANLAPTEIASGSMSDIITWTPGAHFEGNAGLTGPNTVRWTLERTTDTVLTMTVVKLSIRGTATFTLNENPINPATLVTFFVDKTDLNDGPGVTAKVGANAVIDISM